MAADDASFEAGIDLCFEILGFADQMQFAWNQYPQARDRPIEQSREVESVKRFSRSVSRRRKHVEDDYPGGVIRGKIMCPRLGRGRLCPNHDRNLGRKVSTLSDRQPRSMSLWT